jgi:hypothetical protein
MHELPRTWLPNAIPATGTSQAEGTSTEALHTIAKAPPEAGPPRDDKLCSTGMLRYRSTKVRYTREVVYDVKIPKPIDISRVASLSYLQYSSSSDSETSKFSLPKVSAKTEAELLAILAASKEITSSQTLVSESRHSPELNREPGIQDSNNLQVSRVSVPRSPSVVFLHESKGTISPQEDTQLQDIKTTIKRLLSQYPSPEQGVKRLKRQDSQQGLAIFEDTD